MERRRVIVVGGGAAGLMAAGQAALSGAETLLLEKMDRPGRKLGITGKGRCNLTNVASLSQFMEHFGANGRFLRQAFSEFLCSELMAFLNTLGVSTITERGGRVFPASGRAQDVVAALVHWVDACGVKVHKRSPVRKLLFKAGRVTGVEVNRETPTSREAAVAGNSFGVVHVGDAVIVATGGASYPATGSSGDGCRLAESAGHRIVQIRPALVPLETEGDISERLEGLNLRNVRVRITVDGKKQTEGFGEMFFTHCGVSGPVVLSLSKSAVDALRVRKRVTISIDLKPALDTRKLDARLLRELDAHGKKQFHKLLKRVLPGKLIPVCMDEIGVPPNKRGHQITGQERKRLRVWLKDFRLMITGYRPFTEAIITAGGVNTRDVDPRTMASRLVKGLYFAGEVLDLDADTGGYNLQAAFTTGWIAGRASVRPSEVENEMV